ncbi:SNF2-related protein [Nostoc sp. ChiVER01]|uniref:SNF2-related protein n=1 Tax=Nostoc sp. ChiVER01 TaxID=3075382 RepID=UPI002AD3FAD8|nr:SNF2-related protein [Nostoc sp. ChiVER01]MDZ8227285.1 SNF2-related protein [Nostoc sp. ChiVER01]
MVLKFLAIATIKFVSKFTKLPHTTVEEWKISFPNHYNKDCLITDILVSDNICSSISKIVISDNLLLVYPEIFAKHEPLPIVNTYEPFAAWSLSLSNINDYSYLISIIYPQILNDQDIFRLTQAYVSENLFEELKKLSIEGKKFYRLFNSQTGKLQSLPKIRKASSQIVGLDEWDLLYPSLCPPLLFDFADINFFQPLRNYQVEGINFLVQNTSALLADEMGTGKTVQTVNSLRILFRQRKIHCALIICPLSVIGSAYLSEETGKSEGWDGHFYHWARELLVTVVRGSPEQRKIDWKKPAHVYIATYESVRNDIEKGILQKTDIQKFDGVIIDEAQKIKNNTTKISQAIRKFRPKYRWALTGTPIENSIEDVISIFEFLKPNLFNGIEYSPQQVNSIIKPYMLRRLKRHVLQELPPKIPQEDWLELNSNQKHEYEKALNIGRIQLETSIQTESDFQVRNNIFKLIGNLKKICNFASGQSTSPKSELLIEYIETIAANGEKVLVFSQYKQEGINKIETLLNKQKIGFVSYNGEMSVQQKNNVVSQFRNKSDIHVFLATLQSAGTGLTLTEASYVIHFDHWWNPATMKQAEDRAHRVGQENTLIVYSFWMKDTIEEKIHKKLYEKGLLIENVIDSLAEEGIKNSISTEEWLDIFGVKVATNDKKTNIYSIDQNTKPIQSINQSTEPLIDFAIITAIEIEREAVCEAFQITAEHRVKKGSRVYWRKRIELQNGDFYEIIVAQSPDIANVDVALLASDTIHHWHPEAMLMVGIAGAASQEQGLGDIVVGNAVHYYERGKITPDGLKPEPYQYPVDQTLWSRIISLPKWNGIISVSRPDGTNTTPKICLGVIASGEKVIADAGMRDDIAAGHRKIVALEMEGYGVSKAAWQSFERVRHLVIRAICDFADSSKNSEWHLYAASVAAGYTKHFLLDRPLEPRNLNR